MSDDSLIDAFLRGERPAPIDVSLPEEDRQALLLALGLLGAQRPGWDDYLRTIAHRLGDPQALLYSEFRTLAPPKDPTAAPELWSVQKCGQVVRSLSANELLPHVRYEPLHEGSLWLECVACDRSYAFAHFSPLDFVRAAARAGWRITLLAITLYRPLCPDCAAQAPKA